MVVEKDKNVKNKKGKLIEATYFNKKIHLKYDVGRELCGQPGLPES